MRNTKNSPIPIARNYNELLQDFQISLFSTYTKDKWFEELTNSNSITLELLKDDVESLFYKTGGYLDLFYFDDCYLQSKKILANQIYKSISKNRVCFFEQNTKTTKDIYLKVVQRLTNNLYNLFDIKRRTNIINLQTWIIDEIYQHSEIGFILADIKKIANKEPLKLISAIYALLNTFELKTDELIEICEKYDIDKSNFSTYYFSIQFKSLKKQSNNQIVIDFESEIA